MVHALKETWRVTRAHVLDIRPLVGAPKVFVSDARHGAKRSETLCGSLRPCSAEADMHAKADAAVDRVAAEGWFTTAAMQTFEWTDWFDSADELVEAVHEEWESWAVEEDTALKLMHTMERAGRGAAAIRQSIGVRLLKKRHPPPAS